jgi:hypothetical protein
VAHGVGDAKRVVKLAAARKPAAFAGVPRSGMIDEYSPHHAGAQRQEVHAIANRDDAAFDETNECFVDERAGLQRVTDALVRHVADGNAVKLAMHERHQALQRVGIAAAPLDE